MKVYKMKNGQYRITIPKAIGDALQLEGKELQIRIDADKLVLEVKEDEP